MPHKKKGNEVFGQVFNSAVTAIECVPDDRGEIVIFAGSKDGVIKVCLGF